MVEDTRALTAAADAMLFDDDAFSDSAAAGPASTSSEVRPDVRSKRRMGDSKKKKKNGEKEKKPHDVEARLATKGDP